jgi:membrane protein implicated in regulation of membrane protease activity
MSILWWHWMVFGLILTAGELVTPGGFYIIFFGLGALAVGLLSLGDVVTSIWVQVLLFSVLSVGSLLLFRARLLHWLQIDPQQPPVDALIGEVGVANAPLPPGGIGKVELRGSLWSARNVSDRTLEIGARCRVVRVDGLMLLVGPEGAH